MAIYHMSAQMIKRSAGRSSVASASYRAGEKLTDERTGLTHNYSKQEVMHTEIMAPENTPEKLYDRETLWNEVEKTENRKDAQLAREINVAIPHEFSEKEQVEVMQKYAQTFVDKGMVADLAIHDKKDGNPHAHIMLSTREITEDGFGKKNREWNSKDMLQDYRKSWEKVCNEKLQEKGLEERISADSYEQQGIVKEPTIHLGNSAHQLEQQGVETERGNYNREVEEINQSYALELEAIEKELQELENLKIELEQPEKKPPVEIQEIKPEQPPRPETEKRSVSGPVDLNRLQECKKSFIENTHNSQKVTYELGKSKMELQGNIGKLDSLINEKKSLGTRSVELGKVNAEIDSLKKSATLFNSNKKEIQGLETKANRLEQSMKQTLSAISDNWKIEPTVQNIDNLSAMLRSEQAELMEKVDELSQVDSILKENLEDIKIEYQAENMIVELQPNKEELKAEIAELDKKIKDNTPQTYADKLSLANTDRLLANLEKISSRDYKKVLDKVKQKNPDLVQKIQEQMEKERAENRTQNDRGMDR